VFLKDRTIVGVVASLPDHPSARCALRAAGCRWSRRKALAALAGSQMLVRTT
jgi:mycofactocin biosynthesis protein MftB